MSCPIRALETEADEIGLTLAAKACFRPGAAVGVYKLLGEVEAQQGGNVPSMLRTHPMSSVRIEQVPARRHACAIARSDLLPQGITHCCLWPGLLAAAPALGCLSGGSSDSTWPQVSAKVPAADQLYSQSGCRQPQQNWRDMFQ